MPAPLGVAVVGAGRLGAVHARVLSKMEGVRLCGVLDVEASRAEQVARKHGCAVLRDLEHLAREAEAAVIAVPTRRHAEVAGALLAAGLPCLVEKPLAGTLEEGRQILECARKAGLPVMVGHVERFNPAVVALRRLGLEPGFLEAQRVAPLSFRSADVGVVLDVMIHDIDLVLHLSRSRPRDVHAVGVGILGAREDLANARLLFENGAAANVTASRLALKVERRLRLFASDCYVSLDLVARTGRVVRPGRNLPSLLEAGRLDLGRMSPLEAMLKKIVKSESLAVDRRIEPLDEEDREFVSAVRAGREPLVTAEDGLLAMETAQLVMDSIARNLTRRQQMGGGG